MMGILLQYAKFFSDLDEGDYALIEVFAFMSGRELYADACFALRNDVR